MLRLFLVLAALAVGAVACSQTTCMDLCDTSMPCDMPYSCIGFHCVISHGDAGAANCTQ